MIRWYEEVAIEMERTFRDRTGLRCFITVEGGPEFSMSGDDVLKRCSLDDILSVVNGFVVQEGWSVANRGRRRSDSDLRKIFCLMARKAGYPLKRIGDYLAGRDHTTVIHAVEQARAHIEREPEFKNLYNAVLARLVKAHG